MKTLWKMVLLRHRSSIRRKGLESLLFLKVYFTFCYIPCHCHLPAAKIFHIAHASSLPFPPHLFLLSLLDGPFHSVPSFQSYTYCRHPISASHFSLGGTSSSSFFAAAFRQLQPKSFLRIMYPLSALLPLHTADCFFRISNDRL